MADGKKNSKGKDLVQEKQSKKKRGSSSSAHKFTVEDSEVWFSSRNELDHYKSLYANRANTSPRYLPDNYPQEKNFENLERHLKESKLWYFVTRKKSQYNPDFVRAFYSTLNRDGDVLFANINGRPFQMTLEQFGKTAALPSQGDDILTYGGDHWLTLHEATLLNELGFTEVKRNCSNRPTIHSISPEYRVLFYLLTRVIKPRARNHTNLTIEDEKVLHAIILGAHNNWARFVLMHMAEHTSNNHPLPYAFLTVNILTSAGINPHGHALRSYFARVKYTPPPYHATFQGYNFENDGDDDTDEDYVGNEDNDLMDVEDGGNQDDDEDESQRAQAFPDAYYKSADVRDVADAHIQAFEIPSASGRYCLLADVTLFSDVVKIIGKFSTLHLPEM
ncbi:hypothetical protein Tsubulata_051202 [Turnera subulata]|uniref:Uncharacterized protein n=1 Tax=Turnera subulata TaxID=218843 RepID=A0A9Q0J059_9ROSI|nr:hypothetical protein Tsubulata_051202 [Turnera subulata]